MQNTERAAGIAGRPAFFALRSYLKAQLWPLFIEKDAKRQKISIGIIGKGVFFQKGNEISIELGYNSI